MISQCSSLTESFGGRRLLYTHQLPDYLLVSRAVANFARDLSRDQPVQAALDFFQRVKQKASVDGNPVMITLYRQLQLIAEMSPSVCREFAKNHAHELLHTVFFMTRGNCLLACNDCYTDQMNSPQVPWEIYKAIFDEGRKHGMHVIYMAGEGCPLLDGHIGKIFRYAKEYGLQVNMFQDGMIFCHETKSFRKLRGKIMDVQSEISAPAFVRWWVSKPVHLYLKWHRVNKNDNSSACGLPRKGYDYTYQEVVYRNKKIDIPTPILKFPEWGFPLERLGFETDVTCFNADEVHDFIAPWAQEYGYAHFCEPHIDSGRRTLINPMPTSEQLVKLRSAGFLVRQDCTLNKVLSKVVVWPNRGFVSPISAFTWRDLQGRPSMAYDAERGFMHQRDLHPLFQKLRYIGGCPCAAGTEQLQNWLDEFAPRKK